MSSSASRPIPFRCTNDCVIFGCPGHTLVLSFSRTSDVYRVDVDDKPRYWFDEDTFAAILKAHQEMQEREG